MVQPYGTPECALSPIGHGALVLGGRLLNLDWRLLCLLFAVLQTDAMLGTRGMLGGAVDKFKVVSRADNWSASLAVDGITILSCSYTALQAMHCLHAACSQGHCAQLSSAAHAVRVCVF